MTNQAGNNVFCSSCGAANGKGSKFCSTCGKKIFSANDSTDTSFERSNSEKPRSKRTGLRIFVALIFAVIGFKLGSEILPALSFTSWERHVVSYQASYLGSLNSAYSQTEMLGGILGAILFFILGLVFMRLIMK